MTSQEHKSEHHRLPTAAATENLDLSAVNYPLTNVNALSELDLWLSIPGLTPSKPIEMWVGFSGDGWPMKTLVLPSFLEVRGVHIIEQEVRELLLKLLDRPLNQLEGVRFEQDLGETPSKYSPATNNAYKPFDLSTPFIQKADTRGFHRVDVSLCTEVDPTNKPLGSYTICWDVPAGGVAVSGAANEVALTIALLDGAGLYTHEVIENLLKCQDADGKVPNLDQTNITEILNLLNKPVMQLLLETLDESKSKELLNALKSGAVKR